MSDCTYQNGPYLPLNLLSAHTHIEVCVNDQTIKTHRGGGGGKVRF